MMPMLVQIIRSRWFAVGVHAGLWLLLFLAATRFGAKAPPLRDAVPLSTPAQSPAPVSKLEHLFASGLWPRIITDTNTASLFFTRHFIPQPAPAPPPPTTRKIEITYLGFYETDAHPRQAMVKLADALVDKPIGARVSTNWFFAEATVKALTLTNAAGQTTLLPLNTKKEIEVPIP
jgi:hypothetical protein